MPPIKRPSRYIKPEGYRTPKEIVESTPYINKREAIFTKKKGPFSELEEISRVRKKRTVSLNLSKLQDKTYHSHVNRRLNDKPALPSVGDIAGHIDKLFFKNIDVEGIFIIDKKTSKNIGRTFFTFTKKTDKIINEEYKKYKHTVRDQDIIDSYCKSNPEAINILKDDYAFYNMVRKRILFDKLLREKLYPEKKFNLMQLRFKNKIPPVKVYLDILNNYFGIKVRFVPMPGYKFNPDKASFEKIK